MKITIEDIRKLNPCYDPSKYMKDGQKVTVQQILRSKKVPPGDRLWVVCREKFINKEILFKFAENCCWQIVGLLPDDEQLEHRNILLTIRLGRETNDYKLLDKARNAAGSAVWDGIWNAAWDAVWNAAGNAVWNAAGNAARDGARNAARDAARNAGRDEFCLMLADMIDGKMDQELDKMFLMDRLNKEGLL